MKRALLAIVLIAVVFLTVAPETAVAPGGGPVETSESQNIMSMINQATEALVSGLMVFLLFLL